MAEFVVFQQKTHLLDGNNFQVERFRSKSVHEAMEVLENNPDWRGIKITFSHGGEVTGNLAFWKQRIKRIIHPGRPTNYIAYYYETGQQRDDEITEDGEINRRIEYPHDLLNRVLMFCASRPDLNCRIYREYDDGTIIDETVDFWEQKSVQDEGLLTPQEIGAATLNETWMLTSFLKDDTLKGQVRRALIDYAHAVERRVRKGT